MESRRKSCFFPHVPVVEVVVISEKRKAERKVFFLSERHVVASSVSSLPFVTHERGLKFLPSYGPMVGERSLSPGCPLRRPPAGDLSLVKLLSSGCFGGRAVLCCGWSHTPCCSALYALAGLKLASVAVQRDATPFDVTRVGGFSTRHHHHIFSSVTLPVHQSPQTNHTPWEIIRAP